MAEGIIVTCPSCQIQLEAQSDFAGQSVRCPRCNGKVPVPAMAQDIVPAATTRRGLNRAQMKVLWAAVGILVVMVLIPPWRMRDHSRFGVASRPGGYSLIFAPPADTCLWDYRDNIHTLSPLEIDIYRLSFQIIGLVGVAAVAVYGLRRVNTPGPGIVRRGVGWVARHAFILGVCTAIIGAAFIAWRRIGR